MKEKREKQPKPLQEEFYDLPLEFIEWERVKDDYKLIVDAGGKYPDVDTTVKFLDKVNKYLLPGHNFIFDGTISCLEYLVKKKLISVDSIAEDKLKAMILKHINQSSEARDIEINQNPYSFQALLCKVIVVGLYLENRKFKIFRNCTKTIEMFRTLTGGELLRGRTAKTTLLNLTWLGLVQSRPWAKKQNNLSQLLQEKLLESFSPNSAINQVFEKLEPHINKITLKEIPDFNEQHSTFFAVRHAAVIVLYRTLVNYSDNSVQNADIQFGEGSDFMLDDIVQHIFTPKLKFQDWFLKYFDREMTKRVKLIRVFEEEKIMLLSWPDRKVVRYLPILDNFRFMTEQETHFLKVLVPIFRSDKLSKGEKDEIAKRIVFNIQKIILGIGRVEEKHERIIREALVNLMYHILKLKAERIYRDAPKWDIKKGVFEEWAEDLIQTLYSETLDAILEYDASVNSSFFGYIRIMLPFKVRTQLRLKKMDEVTESLDQIMDDSSDTSSVLQDSADVRKVLNRKELRKQIDTSLKTLPQMERQAVKKACLNNEALTDTERRAKNRGLKKLRERHPELRKFLEDFS